MKRQKGGEGLKQFLLGAGVAVLVLTVAPASARYIAQLPPGGGATSPGGGSFGAQPGPSSTSGQGGSMQQQQGGMQQGGQGGMQQQGGQGGMQQGGQQGGMQGKGGMQQQGGMGQGGQGGQRSMQGKGGMQGKEGQGQDGQGETGKPLFEETGGVGKMGKGLGAPAEKDSFGEQGGRFGRGVGSKEKPSGEEGEMSEPSTDREGRFGKQEGQRFGRKESTGEEEMMEPSRERSSRFERQKDTDDRFKQLQKFDSNFGFTKFLPKKSLKLDIPEIDTSNPEVEQLDALRAAIEKLAKVKSKKKVRDNAVALAIQIEEFCQSEELECEGLNDIAKILKQKSAKPKEIIKTLSEALEEISAEFTGEEGEGEEDEEGEENEK